MWISVNERVPTAKDADDRNCVLVWHIFQGVMIKGWHQIHESDPYISHWMKIPKPPQNAEEERRTREKRVKEKRWFTKPDQEP